jgi:mRNA interferase RelE/StbE
MPYTIIVTNPARKQLLKLPATMQERIAEAIDALAEIPRPHGVEPLKGLLDTYRIRVGDYRVIYALHDEELLILVIRVGHRRAIYRKR